MDDIWRVLIQFVFRLTFGIGSAMLVTSSRVVNSGFFRVHLWVLMGINTFGALALFSQRENMTQAGLPGGWLLTLAIGAALLSYVGSVIWIYEKRAWGKSVLGAVTGVALLGALLMHTGQFTGGAATLVAFDVVTSGLLLGTATAAMLLGHWYLNSPGMRLEPLQRLLLILGVVLLFRAVVAGTGLALEIGGESAQRSLLLFASFRWLAGIITTAIMAWMAWQTLKIPNTQSATGILYAAVIVSFLGELTSQLLSADSHYPL